MALPNFLIIGAMKGGTSAAVKNLRRHPDIWMVDRATKQRLGDELSTREMHFFDDDQRYRRGPDWYRAFFEAGREHAGRGEKTPSYLSTLRAHARMHALLPEARLVAFLRDPAERAFSQWRHERRVAARQGRPGALQETFQAAVERELAAAGRGTMREGSMLWRGCYQVQIDHLLRFYARPQLLVCISERVRADMQSGYDRVFEFLGLPPLPQAAHEEAHVGDPGEGSRMTGDVRRRLNAFFEPFSRRLFEFLGGEVEEWGREREREGE